jgi:hypothetical protein
MTTLVKSDDINVMGGIFLNNTLGVIISVERVHQDKRYTDIVFLVQVLHEILIVIQKA